MADETTMVNDSETEGPATEPSPSLPAIPAIPAIPAHQPIERAPEPIRWQPALNVRIVARPAPVGNEPCRFNSFDPSRMFNRYGQ